MQEHLRLRAGDLTDLRADLKQARKKSKSHPKGTELAVSEPQFSAVFSELVDIVITDGGPAFLVLGPDGPVVAPVWEVDGQVVQPPPADKLPWLLPRAAEVMRLLRDPELPARLWEDLVRWFAGVSELLSPAYHLLQASWIFHTYLLEAALYSRRGFGSRRMWTPLKSCLIMKLIFCCPPGLRPRRPGNPPTSPILRARHRLVRCLPHPRMPALNLRLSLPKKNLFFLPGGGLCPKKSGTCSAIGFWPD